MKRDGEDYCSFEITKLLEERGFDEPCYACYEYFKSNVTMYSGWLFEYKGKPVHNTNDRIKCPTHQMALKWFREVHNIHILPQISNTINPKYYSVIWMTAPKRESYILELFNTYEEAVEEAIKYCLKNLI